MAVVPPCSLCKATKFLENKIAGSKKSFLVYSVFIVLLTELFSNIYVNFFYTPINRVYDCYTDFYYPLLTQLVLFLIFASLFLWRERLHFCLRKASATMYLSIYYLFGFLAVLFCFSANFYFQVVNFSIISLSMLLFVQSIYSKRL